MGYIGDKVIQRLDIRPLPKGEAVHEEVPDEAALAAFSEACQRVDSDPLEKQRILAIIDLADGDLDDEAGWVSSGT